MTTTTTRTNIPEHTIVANPTHWIVWFGASRRDAWHTIGALNEFGQHASTKFATPADARKAAREFKRHHGGYVMIGGVDGR